MDFGLTGKVAIVTGASRGLGEGIARALAAEGCKLVLCARGADALRATAQSIAAASGFGREVGGPGLALYDTTKAAVIALAKTMALDLAPERIRVNSIAPGSVRFPGGSWDERCKKDPEGMAVWIGQNLPLGRFGSVEEIANAAAFLVS